MSYQTRKVNPSSPILRLTVGELDLTLENSPDMTKYLFGFSMNRSAEDSANDCIFRLFDETALLLEYALLQGARSVTFQYGQDEATLSKRYAATIQDYNLEFTGGGNVILELQVVVGADISSDESSSYNSNPGEAFLQVCEEEGWTVGNFTETKDTEKESYLRTGQSATEFIKGTLIPDAVSVDGVNDYYFWTDTDGETGNTLANFTPKGEFIDSNGVKVYEILIGGGADDKLQCEGIISFEPAYNGLFYNFFNEGGTAALQQSQYGTHPGTTPTNPGTGLGPSTPEEFQKALFVGDSLFVGLKNSVSGINVMATGGEAVHQGLDRYKDAVIASQAPIVIFDYGVNDAGHNNTDLFKRKYAEFITAIKNGIPGVKIYVNKIFEGDLSKATGTARACLIHVQEYNQALLEIVQTNGIGYIDATNLDYKSYYTSDGIHFNGSFYKLWYDEMCRQVSGQASSGMRSYTNASRALEPGTGSKFIGYGWATRDCGLYEGTSRDTKMKAKIFKGRKLTLMWETPAWYYVRYTQTLYGYILKSSITLTDPGTGLDDVHNPIDKPITTDPSTPGDSVTDTVIQAITNGGMSNPAYILEVPTVDELTNKVIDPYTDNGIKRRIGSSNYNSVEMGRIAEYMWTKSQALANTAQLTLRGDATFEAMSFVAIVVLTPDGFFHHSSGLYQVLEISDDIDGGEYTTTLNLVKMGLNVNEDGSITVRETSEVVFPQGLGYAGGTPGTTPGSGSPLAGGGTINETALRSVLDKYNGCGYSQSARTGPNSYDCSSLVNVVMGDLGIAVNWATTAVGVEKVGSGQWGQVVWKKGQGTLTTSMIACGDVFVYNNGSSNHTGIFVNSEQMFHASNPTKGVLYGSTSYYIDYLNKYNGTRCYVVRPPASSGTPVQNNGIKSRIN